MAALWGNERREALQTLLLCQRRSPSTLKRESQLPKREQGRPCSNPHLLAPFRFSVKLPEIHREQNSANECCDFFRPMLRSSIFSCFVACLFFLRKRQMALASLAGLPTYTLTIHSSGPLGHVFYPKAVQQLSNVMTSGVYRPFLRPK